MSPLWLPQFPNMLLHIEHLPVYSMTMIIFFNYSSLHWNCRRMGIVLVLPQNTYQLKIIKSAPHILGFGKNISLSFPHNNLSFFSSNGFSFTPQKQVTTLLFITFCVTLIRFCLLYISLDRMIFSKTRPPLMTQRDLLICRRIKKVILL